jgi:hypothetical protein
MNGLTAGAGSLLDLIDMPDDQYAATKAVGTAGVTNSQIFPVLDEARRIVRSAAAGSNVIRYLLLRMHNEVIKEQYNWEHCARLSGMNLPSGPPFSVAYPRRSAVLLLVEADTRENLSRCLPASNCLGDNLCRGDEPWWWPEVA